MFEKSVCYLLLVRIGIRISYLFKKDRGYVDFMCAYNINSGFFVKLDRGRFISPRVLA